MGEWKRIKLSEVLKEKTERNKNNETDLVLSVTNSQGFVKQSDFFEGTVHSEDISNYKLVKKNEFAYNPSRINVGSIDILKEYDIGALSPMYVIFSVDETKLLPDYFKHYFQTHKFNENVKNNTQGSVRNSLSFKALSEFEYLLPPLEEQKRIVKILDQVNRIIEKYQNLISEKEQFIKSQFVEMFIKTNYQRITLNEISSIKGEYGLSVSSKSYDESLGRYIRITDINDDGTLNTDWTSPMTDKNIENYILKEGDILFARTGGTVGKTYKYRLSDGKCSYAGYCIRFRIASEKTNPDYIYAYTKTNEYKNWIKDRQRVGAQPNINSNEYGNELEIPLPPIEKQKEFIELKQLIDKQKFHSVLKNIIKVKESEVYA